MNIDRISNYDLFRQVAGVSKQELSYKDMNTALHKGAQFVDTHRDAIEQLADTLGTYYISQNASVNSSELMPVMRSALIMISWLAGYSMGRKAEKNNWSLEKMLEGFPIDLGGINDHRD